MSRLADLIASAGVNPYAGSMADTMLRSGDARANAELGAGQAWGQGVQQLGAILQNGLKQYQDQKDAAQTAKLRDVQIQTGQAELGAGQQATRERTAVDTAMGSGLDIDTISKNLIAQGYGHLVPGVRKSWNDAETAAEQLKVARATVGEKEADYFGSLAAGVKPFLAGPDGGMGAVTIALQHAKAAGYDDADSLLEQLQGHPEALPQIVNSLIEKSPTQRKLAGEEGDRALRQTTEERMAAQARQAAADREADNLRADKQFGETMRHDKAMEARPVAGAATSAALTDDGIEYAATQYRVTGRMPSLGNGAGDVKAKIISNAAAQAKALGQTPAASIQKQAAYAGDAKALAQMQKMSASAGAFENKASAQVDIVRDLSEKVSRTQYPILNSAIVAGKADLLGDKNAQLLYNAIETFSTEYAKIMEGSTGSAAASSDSARAAAKRLISAKLNKGTMSDTLDLMQREMNLTLQGYDATIAAITERMGGTPQPAQTPPPAAPGGPGPVGAPTYQDYLKSRGGK